MKYALMFVTVITALACQHTHSSRRNPSSLPSVDESDRVFDGTVIAFDKDVKLSNEDVQPQRIQVNGVSVVVDDDGNKGTCALSVDVNARAIALIQAGRRLEVRWVPAPMGGVPFLGLFDEGTPKNGYDGMKGTLHCLISDKDGYSSWGPMYLGPMTMSVKYLESSLSLKVMKRAVIEELQADKMKDKTNDDKMLKEYSL